MRGPKRYLLGIDIGTSSSKGVLVRPDGTVIRRATREHALSLPRPGWAEHDADSVWWQDFADLTRTLCADRPALDAIAVSGIGPCLLPADADGSPLRTAILYGIDTRAEREIGQLNARFGRDEILQRSGSALSSQAVGPKIAWLRRNEPDVWRRTRRFYMASSFIVGRLTGAYVLDHLSASQCNPMYDIKTGAWARDWAEEIAPSIELPPLLWPTEVAGHVSPSAARRLGISAGIPVTAGTIDAWAEALSAGVREPGDAMLMYGTTMFIVAVVDRLRTHPAMWGTAGVMPESRTTAAGMATSGALTSWFRSLVGNPDYESLLESAAQVPPGSDGLVALPYFAGERSPLYDPSARGLILGLTLSHGRGHIYRALLEATAFGVRHILETMADVDMLPKRLVAVGGGTRAGLWTQIVSDVTGRTQDLPEEAIGASYGDALLAAISSGSATAETSWARVAARIEPDDRARSTYDAMYATYRSLYPATRAQAHRLARLQSSTAPSDRSA